MKKLINAPDAVVADALRGSWRHTAIASVSRLTRTA